MKRSQGIPKGRLRLDVERAIIALSIVNTRLPSSCIRQSDAELERLANKLRSIHFTMAHDRIEAMLDNPMFRKAWKVAKTNR